MVLRSLAALAVPLVLLVSCTNDDPDPILAPSVSPTPTSDEPSPTETASEEPESPEEFIERWVKIYNDMQTTGDTSEYRAASQGCGPCEGVADQIETIHGGGGEVRTEGWDVLALQELAGSADEPVLDVRIRSAPTRYTETPSGPVQTFPGGRFIERFELERVDGSWNVRNTAQVSS